MSLFGTLQIANNALIAQQLGLQVVGNNIANANTPGYVRQELLLTPAPTQQYGGVVVGLGVEVAGIRQKTDRFLEERLRDASADLANSESQDKAYVQLEALMGELSDTDLSSVMSSFFGSVHDVLNQPESLSVRNVAIQQGQRLADDIRHLDGRVREIRKQVDTTIASAANDVNRLVEGIAKLNIQVTTFEGGDVGHSPAVGMRDRRTQLLNELGKLVSIKTYEQDDGSVSVYVGGDYLVHEGQFREVGVERGFDRGQSVTQLKIVDSDSALAIASGEVAGHVFARDQILGGYLDQLDQFTRTMMHEFNKVFSSGQGLSGYSSSTSEFAADDSEAPLDAAGLPFTPVNGSLQLLVRNKQTGITRTTDLRIQLNGLDDDTTLDDLATAIDAVDGVSASVGSDGRLELSSDSANLDFAFARDTSGVLAALGVNTFFSGSGSSDIEVHQTMLDDPGKFAASRGGIGADTENALALAELRNTPLESQNGQSLANLYDRFVGNLAQAGAASSALAEGYRSFHATLDSELLSVSGVSLDEEAIKMITYQRAFQASARFVKTISDLLETLVNL